MILRIYFVILFPYFYLISMGIVAKPFIGIALNGLVLYLLTKLVTDISYTGGLKFFVLGGIVLGLINLFVRPIIKILSLPAMIITGGLFLIVINIFILWFLVYFFRFAEFRDVTLVFPNFSSYVIGAIVFGVINWSLNLIK